MRSQAAAVSDITPDQNRELIANLGNREWRLSNLYWIVDAHGQRTQFRPNAVQQEINNNLWYLNVILKSRQHGITTDICILYLDYCLFHPNIRAGINAHSREDAESFFNDKIKYAYDNLIPAVKAIIPARSDSARELSFANNSAIRVATSLRGGTYQLVHITEFGKICAKYPDKAREIITGTLNTVHPGEIVTIESTAEGRSGKFYEMCQDAMKARTRGGALNMMEWRFFFFPWFMDPKNRLDTSGVVIPATLAEYYRKIEVTLGISLSPEQKAWYYMKWRTQGSDMKREYPSSPEESFESSIQGAYFASQFERIYREGRIARVPYEEGLPVYTFWDLGMDDTTAIWFVQFAGKEKRVLDFYEHSGEGLAHYAQVVRDKGYEYGVHYGPHDIKVRELGTGKSRQEQAQKYGLNFQIAPRLDKSDQIESARNILQFCWFDEAKCDSGIKALESYQKQWDEKNACYRDNPLHNWASNAADAFQIFAVVSDSITGSSLSGWTPRR